MRNDFNGISNFVEEEKMATSTNWPLSVLKSRFPPFSSGNSVHCQLILLFDFFRFSLFLFSNRNFLQFFYRYEQCEHIGEYMIVSIAQKTIGVF